MIRKADHYYCITGVNGRCTDCSHIIERLRGLQQRQIICLVRSHNPQVSQTFTN
jgi:hypothetical protein